MKSKGNNNKPVLKVVTTKTLQPPKRYHSADVCLPAITRPHHNSFALTQPRLSLNTNLTRYGKIQSMETQMVHSKYIIRMYMGFPEMMSVSHKTYKLLPNMMSAVSVYRKPISTGTAPTSNRTTSQGNERHGGIPLLPFPQSTWSPIPTI
jgi:hypothetical protein